MKVLIHPVFLLIFRNEKYVVY